MFVHFVHLLFCFLCFPYVPSCHLLWFTSLSFIFLALCIPLEFCVLSFFPLFSLCFFLSVPLCFFLFLCLFCLFVSFLSLFFLFCSCFPFFLGLLSVNNVSQKQAYPFEPWLRQRLSLHEHRTVLPGSGPGSTHHRRPHTPAADHEEARLGLGEVQDLQRLG